MHEEKNMRSQIKEKKNNSGTETNRTLRYLVSFLVIMGLLVVLFFWNIGVGSLFYSCRKRIFKTVSFSSGNG